MAIPTRLRYGLDVQGPGLIYVLCLVRRSPKYGRRVAGPFGNEHAAELWITENASAPFVFLGVAS